jgi:DNA-damage-inducible protein J
MSTTAMLHVRVSCAVKEKAAKALEGMGLSVSDAVRVLLVRIAEEQKIPFEIKVPNAETIEAMEAARRGEGTAFNSIEELMVDLNADN